MAYDFSSRKHPGTDVVQTTGVVKLNNFVDDVETAANELLNMIETHAEALTICTSATRPASPSLGELIVETDTGKMYQCTNAVGPVWSETFGQLAKGISQMLLTEQGVAPSTGASQGALYAKNVNGQPELFYREEGDGDEVQLTRTGGLNLPDIVQSGQIAGLRASKSDPNTVAVSAGWCHLKDSSGDTYLVQYAGGTVDAPALSGEGAVYVLVDSAGVLTCTLTAPTYDTAKLGWYDASGDKRMIGTWVYGAGVLRDGSRDQGGTVVRLGEVVSTGSLLDTTFADVNCVALGAAPAIDGVMAELVIWSDISLTGNVTTRKNGTNHPGTKWFQSVDGPVAQIEVPLDSSGIYEWCTGGIANAWYEHAIVGYKEVR